MRRLLPRLAPVLVLLGTGCSGSGRTSTISSAAIHPAIIRVHSRSKGAISPLLFGANIEWTDNGNRILDPKSGELRPSIVEALAPLQIPVLRFPGGILSDYYHWQDGIGSAQGRPVRVNPMDGSRHTNDFGTDEFIRLCQQLHAQPLITANLGTGSAAEAAKWQKYFGDHGLRVPYWEIGNEIYLAEPRRAASIPGNDQRIFKTAAQYANAFHQYRQSLRSGDSNALVGAIAGTYNTSVENRGWLDTLLRQESSEIDFLALHNSFAPIILDPYDYSSEAKRSDAYLASYAQALAAGDDIATVRTSLLRAKSPAAERIAITEHFPLFGVGGSHEQLLTILDQSRTMAAAAYTASLFHTYMREGVWMANYNLAVSQWFGALTLDTDHGAVRSPVWYVFDLYRNHFGGELLEVDLTSSVYATSELGVVRHRENIPLLDAVASRDQEGHTFLAVINRHPSNAIASSIFWDDKTARASRIYTLSGPAPNAVNGASLSPTTRGGDTHSVTTREASPTLVSGGTYTFPAMSVTVIEWSSAEATGLVHQPRSRNGVNE